ncbi:MAG: ABC transporter ATP-binding protein [Saccharolobus sp.]|uniref:ABC transporter ATP-binding protein n=1 Tax=Saccharolobus sp. TaxID=2100761 RepID=UPI003180C46F
MILEVNKISKRFGGLIALNEVSFKVNNGEIVSIIGPNGSGKTTLFNIISGIYLPDNGKIIFEGQDITKISPYRRCKLGIGRTFQIVRPFNEMSVLDNVKVGLMYGRGNYKDLKDIEENALELLVFVNLHEKKSKKSEELTLIEKKKLEIARALATKPKIILLDEPLAGLTSSEIPEACKMISRIRDEKNITVVWIEHIMHAVMSSSDRIIVLNRGEKIAEGTPREVASKESVIKAYLGEKYARRLLKNA